MTDKQNSPSETCDLPDWQVLEVVGTEAAAFLQAQTMNDVLSLAPGTWQWNGWLNPKGRVIALFALAALDAQRYWLIAPDFPAAELASRLQRFVFRSKVKLTPRQDVAALGEFGSLRRSLGARGSSILGDSDAVHECQSFDMGDSETTRSLVIGTVMEAEKADELDLASATARAAASRRWVRFDLAHGLPRLSMEQSEQWTPQML